MKNQMFCTSFLSCYATFSTSCESAEYLILTVLHFSFDPHIQGERDEGTRDHVIIIQFMTACNSAGCQQNLALLDLVCTESTKVVRNDNKQLRLQLQYDVYHVYDINILSSSFTTIYRKYNQLNYISDKIVNSLGPPAAFY